MTEAKIVRGERNLSMLVIKKNAPMFRISDNRVGRSDMDLLEGSQEN